MSEETRGPKLRMYAENQLGYLWLPKNEYLEFKEHAYSGDGICINITPLAKKKLKEKLGIRGIEPATFWVDISEII